MKKDRNLRLLNRETVLLNQTAIGIAYITLLDVSPRQDVESSIIARQTITDPDQLPIAFEVPYNPNQIHSDHLYAIQAQVTTEGRVILRNRSAHPVITQGNPSVVEVLVDWVK